MDILGHDFPYSPTSLAGKHAFVCGASKGIGAATALLLAKCGADVTVAARDEQALESLVHSMAELGTGHHGMVVVDLENEEDVRETANSVLESRG
ncbi:MAG: SDR family NAD(P)-dependent oxidoreductase, partial [Candidatus Poseidoniales archaeon]